MAIARHHLHHVNIRLHGNCEMTPYVCKSYVTRRLLSWAPGGGWGAGAGAGAGGVITSLSHVNYTDILYHPYVFNRRYASHNQSCFIEYYIFRNQIIITIYVNIFHSAQMIYINLHWNLKYLFLSASLTKDCRPSKHRWENL